MKFLPCGARRASWCALLLLAAPGLQAADVFLAPRLTLETGYEDNRFLMPTALTNTESSAFLRATPAVGLHLLTANGAEVSVGAYAARTEYLRSDLDAREELAAHFEWWQTGAPLEGGLRLAGGGARDSALPEDDYRWFAATPSLRYTCPDPDWQVTAQARLALAAYDTRLTTAGEKQTDQTLELRPGVRWLPTGDSALWCEVYVENNASNEDAFDYQGVGLTLGGSLWLTPRGQMVAAVQWGTRSFASVTDELGAAYERKDQPLRADINYTYRLFPWLDLFCSAAWFATGSNQPAQDINGWSVQAGVMLAQDYALFSSRR